MIVAIDTEVFNKNPTPSCDFKKPQLEGEVSFLHLVKAEKLTADIRPDVMVAETKSQTLNRLGHPGPISQGF